MRSSETTTLKESIDTQEDEEECNAGMQTDTNIYSILLIAI